MATARVSKNVTARVVRSTDCPACGVGAGVACRDLATGTHPERAAARHDALRESAAVRALERGSEIAAADAVAIAAIRNEPPRRGPGQPRKPESERRRVVGFSLSPSELAALEAVATRRATSKSAVIGALILAAFRERNYVSAPGKGRI